MNAGKMRIGLNGNQLKLIAVVSMIIDHIAYLFIGEGMLAPAMQAGKELPAFLMLYRVMRVIGRIAFPIFCFLLVEGFLHTKSRQRYAIRLGLFALISELPFDLFISGNRFFVNWEFQNVMITLLLGLIMLELLERLDIRKKNALDQGRSHISGAFQPELLAQLFVIFLFCAIAWIVRCDYGYIGIMLTALFYWFRWDRKYMCIAGFLWMAVINQIPVYLPTLALSFVLIFLYNGTRGKGKSKYAGYLFYPVHMAVFALIYTFL